MTLLEVKDGIDTSSNYDRFMDKYKIRNKIKYNQTKIEIKDKKVDCVVDLKHINTDLNLQVKQICASSKRQTGPR